MITGLKDVQSDSQPVKLLSCGLDATMRPLLRRRRALLRVHELDVDVMWL